MELVEREERQRNARLMAASPAVQALTERADAVMPGGVSSSSRRHEALARPLYIREGRGPRVTDADGNEFIDFTGGSGASMLGHGHPAIDAAVREAIARGTVCTAETEAQVELAERICELIPSAAKVRFVSTGTEATLAALRIARAATGREKVLRFAGHYHGMHDGVLVGWTRSPAAGEAPRPDSLGIPSSLAELVVVAPFNDPVALAEAMELHGDQLAAVILEPVSYNLGCVPADAEWLAALRAETARRGIVLIFDEILSGFRMGIAGAQGYYGITPDVTTLGKTLGGGWPISAIAGCDDVMSVLGPGGGVPLSGTFTTHLSAVLAALAALELMSEPGFYDALNGRADRFVRGLQACFDEAGVKARVQSLGARFGIYFGLRGPATDFESALPSDVGQSHVFAREALRHGLYFADFPGRRVPMHYGIGAAHSDTDVDESLAALAEVAKALAAEAES
jgi:glutamate-1-semialdehyde 2,1-aminomutase